MRTYKTLRVAIAVVYENETARDLLLAAIAKYLSRHSMSDTVITHTVLSAFPVSALRKSIDKCGEHLANGFRESERGLLIACDTPAHDLLDEINEKAEQIGIQSDRVQTLRLCDAIAEKCQIQGLKHIKTMRAYGRSECSCNIDRKLVERLSAVGISIDRQSFPSREDPEEDLYAETIRRWIIRQAEIKN